MADVRFAIAGYGNIGRTHCDTLANGEVARGAVSAVVAREVDDLPAGVVRYATLQQLFAADAADAVIVATPTMTHPQLGAAVLSAGRHLVMEKPLAMSVRQARGLIDAVPAGVQAAVMLNQRYHPVYREIKNIIEQGALGRLVRFNWIMTAWYRPDVYFQVSRWRGTWPGEGGGALLNQCIHNLDILCWLLGRPESVAAEACFGKFHDIEVEDEVTALLRFADGVTGSMVASTGEAPGMNRLDIVGDRGTLRFDGDSLTLTSGDVSVTEHCATTNEMFGMPRFVEREIAVGEPINQHAAVLQNVVDAIADGAELTTPLREGLRSVELANAMLLSAWEDRRVSLPLDAELYERRLQERIAASGFREPQALDVRIDMDASYR